MEITALELTSQYGYGYGGGEGYGYGYGYGGGYGGGDGYGYGYGDGDGDGEKEYLAALLQEHRLRNSTAAFWRSSPEGNPSNGGSGTLAKEGLTEEIQGPLKLCTKNALHATLNPRKWMGEHWWVVALHDPVEVQEDKMGSLKRTFIKHLGKCPF